MDFTLTDEQELLRTTARTLLAKECPPSLVRAAMDDPAAAAPLWGHLQDWVALGSGPLVDLCLFLEETGTALAPGPFFATAALYVPLLQAAGDPRADDPGSGTVALAGTTGQWVLPPDGDRTRTFVLEADRVEQIAVVLPGPSVAVVASPPPGGLRRTGSLDLTRRAFELAVPDGAGVPAVPVDAAALSAVVERATVALAAEMVGTARWLLDTSVQYAKDRVQFDRPIGSFQAIQHKLADMALAVERATAAVYYAAMCIDAGSADRHRAAHVAKASAGAAATRCAKDGIQIHGGIGYTWEHDLHLWIRRAYGSEHLLGTTAWHHDRLADLLLGPVPDPG